MRALTDVAARADRRARPAAADGRDRAAADRGAARDGGRGRAAEHQAPGEDQPRASSEEVATLEREIWDLAGTEFTIGSPQQLGEILFDKLGLSQEAPRQDRLLHRRARAAGDPRRARDRPEDRALARAQPARQDLPRRAAAARRRALADPHDVPAGGRARPGRLASTNPNMQNVPVRTELGREIRGCFEAEEPHVLISADYSQVELRVLAHVADEPVLKEIFLRGEDVHTATGVARLRQARRRAHADGSLEVEDDQLRDRLRPERLRPRRPAEHPARGGQGVHRRLPRALPEGARRSSPARSSRRPRRASSRRCSAAAARSPSSRRATTRCGRWASASRSTP